MGILPAVEDTSFTIEKGQTLGVVGESGSGKSTMALALMGLLPKSARVTGSAFLGERELLHQSESQWRQMRGDRIAMIFQEPMTALNPVLRIGEQIGETLVLHQHLPARAAAERAIEMLDEVGIPSARTRARAYPHQLDVTIQAQILELMLELQDRIGMAIQFISHNLGVISELADEIIVMYAGRIVERAPAARLFSLPLHPYTLGLIRTLPDLAKRERVLPVIPGGMPNLALRPAGCAFAPRCERAIAQCLEATPALRELGPGHDVACIRAET
jgi:oligopeptide/dipeptide ABC transporter ATP-binding protein